MEALRTLAFCLFTVTYLVAMRLLAAPRRDISVAAHVAFVWADALWISSSPTPGRKRLLQVRVNTPLIVQEVKAGWSRVKVPPSNVTGYVPSKFLVKYPLRVAVADATSKRALAQGQLARALRWAERAVAVDGRAPWRWQRLERLYWRTGQSEQAQRTHAVLLGQARIFFAVCERSEVKLLGAVEEGERTVLPSALNDLDREQLRQAGWYRLDATNVRALPLGATPFLQAEFGAVQLARCDLEGAVYATAPLARAQGLPFSWDETALLVTGAAGDVRSVEAGRLAGGLLSAQLRVAVTHEGFVDDEIRWRVFDRQRHLLFAPKRLAITAEAGVRWLHLGPQGNVLVALYRAPTDIGLSQSVLWVAPSMSRDTPPS